MASVKVRCTDVVVSPAGCEVTLTLGAPPGCLGHQDPTCCCDKAMQLVSRCLQAHVRRVPGGSPWFESAH